MTKAGSAAQSPSTRSAQRAVLHRVGRHRAPADTAVSLLRRACSVAGAIALVFQSLIARSEPARDEPFLQDVAVRVRVATELAGCRFQKLRIDKEGTPYVLTDRGLARVYEDLLTLDRSFRPLADQKPVDIALGPDGDLYYLFHDRWLSNGKSGEPLGRFPVDAYRQIGVKTDGSVVLLGAKAVAIFEPKGKPAAARTIALPESWPDKKPALEVSGSHAWVRVGDELYSVENPSRPLVRLEGLTTVAVLERDKVMLLGSESGYAPWTPGAPAPAALQTKLPVPFIRRVVQGRFGWWFATPRGVFFERTEPAVAGIPALPDGPHGIRYYASRRWLLDDDAIDLAVDSEGHLWVLTGTGLNKIEFRPMTLATKEEYFYRKIRSRHIRYGLAAERRMINPGDLASSEMIDTDNDGGWSSYYLASLAWKYAVTKSEEVRKHAWEVFSALERLQTIHTNTGFPARTIERRGYKFSDPDRWREAAGDDWDWKGHTSSDEITSQTFAHAVMWELVAANAPEKARIATNYTRIVDHILRHNLYMVDVDGQPTLWGRWNPEYVNHYPNYVGDRRLNSAELTAYLQLAFAFTGRTEYRDKAYVMFTNHGYLTNLLSSLTLLRRTTDVVFKGNYMGDEWNHSDDELAFFNYWTLYRFAFTPELKAQYAEAIRDHWQIERVEGFPPWNLIHAACGGGTRGAADVASDLDITLWSLRGFPLDTISWTVENSHRKDLLKLAENFRKQGSAELLPPGERLIARCNTQTMILDGGDGGRTEFPGDEFLVGYWLARYLKLLE